MELKESNDIEHSSFTPQIQHDLWPLDPVDPNTAKFPCCLVWNPLPVVSWLAPFIGHVGICREDGVVLDFSGSYTVNVDDFAFGSVAKYVQLDRKQCCLPPNPSAHTCKQGYRHSEYGTAITWDDAIQSSVREYESKTHNTFTCNCHSFVANCLNRMSYGGSMKWNMVNVGAMLLFKGHWVGIRAIIRAFLPFVVVSCFGVFAVGWPFLLGLLSFSLLLLLWFLLGTYFLKNMLEC
ncbi:protein REVERSION-TO-ETHYLENE SENSITIVITY1 [Cajanus cajan]|uniref:Transmembrane protein 222 family n=1 Tax=Cajanus cajan TaxID=3821 RepID=A0A151TZ34_CAJCA|nr:protein REVERSION-TO-ETHYLENE SENSITIVITY1 [Cajanus cajan]KYP72258.1 Transmembrane protein 222 family [Cajanus cajan]